VIDRDLKRSLGQMIHGVQVVGAAHDGVTRAYTSHWVMQVAFEEPVLLASISPKHDTHPLVMGSGRFSVSILAADQVDAGQYFSYPGHRFRYVAEEYLSTDEPGADGLPVMRHCIAWLRCDIERVETTDETGLDHDLVFGRVVATGEGRLREPPLLYSSRLGWRVTGDKAREQGRSIRDELLARLDESDDD
jgi:3-hydroxy-9,10-secoandrosta-1,3,5(10)-triene-9,17-dione monooxygenase reductase component